MSNIISLPFVACPVCKTPILRPGTTGKILMIIMRHKFLDKEHNRLICPSCGAKLIPSPLRIVGCDMQPVWNIDVYLNRFCHACGKWEPTIKYTNNEHTMSVCSHCSTNLIIKYGANGIEWGVDTRNQEKHCDSNEMPPETP